MQEQYCVEYSNSTIDPSTQKNIFWFNVVGHRGYYAGCFGLHADGTNMPASGKFNELPLEIQEDLLDLGRQLLPKVVS